MDMTDPLDDIKIRADAVKAAMRSITGMPSTSFRDVLSASVANMSNRMLGQMQPQQPAQQQPQNQASLPSDHADITPPQPSTPQVLGSRNRVLGTLFRSLFRGQQPAAQQEPISQQQPRQGGQRDVSQPSDDYGQDAQSRALERSRQMSIADTKSLQISGKEARRKEAERRARISVHSGDDSSG